MGESQRAVSEKVGNAKTDTVISIRHSSYGALSATFMWGKGDLGMRSSLEKSQETG
jgi:hypothetical protein